jgi:hypothetical protein
MDDFAMFLDEIGVSQEQMDAAASAMPAPLRREDAANYCVRPSPIHGAGCFATADINGLIGRLRHKDDWYEAGRYINHSLTPNAKAVRHDEALFAYGSVSHGDEITLDYRQVRDAMMRNG